MGKIIKFPTGELLDDDGIEVNKNFQNLSTKRLKEIEKEMNETYFKIMEFVDLLLKSQNEKYIDEKNADMVFETTMIEIIKLYLANSNYNVKNLYNKLKDFLIKIDVIK